MEDAGEAIQGAGVMYRLVYSLREKVQDQLVCDTCESLTLVVNVFVKIRLHYKLREQSKAWATSGGRKNRQVIKFSHH